MAVYNQYGIVERKEIIKEEQEFMFPEAKVYSDQERLTKHDQPMDYYFKKLGDARFTISGKITTAKYNYNIEINTSNKITEDKLVEIDNIINCYLVLKGDKVLDCIKLIEKRIKKEVGISCSVEFGRLSKMMNGEFEVKNETFGTVTLSLESVETQELIPLNITEEVNV